MNRIRGGALLIGCALLFADIAYAQEVTGRVIGRVLDKDTGAPLGGITVIVQGPQGEDGTITDGQGNFDFSTLAVGTYVVRFYVANSATQVEQPNVRVMAQKTVRVNARIAGSAQAATEQTYVVRGKSPTIDVGSGRVGSTFDEGMLNNLPLGRTYGDVIEKAPGAFVDPSGSVSIGGATGLENVYMVNGLNVTGIEYGNLESGAATLGGGTNIPIEFLSQIDVNSGGYQAEFGGGMGGVINTVLKSGSNQFRGSVFGYWSPYWLSGETAKIPPTNGSLGGWRRPDYDSSFGAEVSGPLIKDKLFFWVGFAPRLINTHVFRLTYALQDTDGDGVADVDASGNPIRNELTDWRARINESRKTFTYAATVDAVVSPDHKLTMALVGTPSANEQMRAFAHTEATSNPSWARESQTKNNTAITARWVSKLFDRRWVIEANAGLHRESYDNRSPNDALNQLNQLEYRGTNLWDLERAPGCEPSATGFQPCPVDQYKTGGFGLIKKYTGQRWMAELKSTHREWGHELKYGWRVEYATFDQDRNYSGPLGKRGLVSLSPNGGDPVGLPVPYFSTYSLFTLPRDESITRYGGADRPFTDLLYPPTYQDNLKAYVKSVSNSFFIQDSFKPGLDNLTLNVGGRYELQKLYDFRGDSFLDLSNVSPRISAVLDPWNDGRSKVSVAYGRYYTGIPLNMAARYFGGEGLLGRNGVPLTECPNMNANSWTGAGEWRDCFVAPLGGMDVAAGGTTPLSSTPTVQARLKGQYHNEIVATVEREVIEDLSVRLDYQHRWLGNIVEDGTADQSGSFQFVVANPGNVPQGALDDAKNDVTRLMGADQSDPVNAAALASAQAKLANLEGLANAPKPKRTYDAVTLSVNKRFSRAWQARASYTYSRLIGNYQGLYQVEGDVFQPNVSNAYDTPDLYHNQNGPLPNDRPHQARLDGYYTYELGKGRLTTSLGLWARSGMPRNYVSYWYFFQPQNLLLPRGSAGRTPTTTQVDLRFSYGRQLAPNVTLEGFVDLFNLFNQKTAVLTDDVYTYDLAPAIVNGTKEDLKFAKNGFGQPINKNPNFGNPVAYQLPFNARFGLRLTF